MKYAGGCLCGALRYNSNAGPLETGYCHCRMCQKLSGAAALPWVSFSTDSFAYAEGSPKIYISSSWGRREFCAECGSQIAFRTTDTDETVEINIGTLDDPEAAIPQSHVWCSSQVSWFDTKDGLPRYPGAGETKNST